MRGHHTLNLPQKKFQLRVIFIYKNEKRKEKLDQN
jgi:hypothetical protein